MASVAGATSKLTDEAIEFLSDKIARLKANGNLEEVAEAEEQLARMKRRAASGPITSPREPETPVKDLPEMFDSTPSAPTGTGSFDDFSTPLPRRGGKSAVATGAAGLGLGLSSSLGTEDTRPPLTPPVGEEQKEVGVAMAAGGEPRASKPTVDTVVAPEIKDFLSGLGNIPQPRDLTQWDSDINAVADKRQARINEFKNDVLTATATAQAASSSIEKRELVETITNAIGQIASGMYGMKHGLDLSGAKFNKTDWNAKLEAIQRNLKDSVQRLADEQQLDQAVLSETKENLLRNKDDLIKDYEMKFRNWQGKAEVAKSRQGLATDQARMDFDADKFNADLKLRSEEAVRRAAKEGAAAKDSISAGIKSMAGDTQKALDKWNSLALQYGSDKTTDDQRAAIRAQMEELDGRVTALRGYPILAGAGENGVPTLTPRSYNDLDIEDVVAEKAAAEQKLSATVASFKHPENIKYAKTILPMRDKYIEKFAEEEMARGSEPAVAFSMARVKYNAALQNMFAKEYGSVKLPGTAK